jgi:hypothetical protein
MVSDYKYEKKPAYRAKVDQLEQEEDEAERQRIRALRQELAIYIQEDLEREAAPGE